MSIKYVDTNKIEIPKGFFNDLNVPKFFQWLNDLPTANVVPKSEVAREIFEEIENCMSCFEDDDDGYLLKKCEFEFFMRELKKEYTEESGNDR